MKRRTFLHTASTALGAAALGAGSLPEEGGALELDPSSAAPAIHPSQSPDVVVVGAGTFGAWTALHLLERGMSVTLVDAYGPGNYRSTSGGDSRGIRVGYGSREIYTRWALDSFERWEQRQEEWGVELMVPCGRLTLAPARTPGMEVEARILDRHGVENEFLTPDEIRRRWPQFGIHGVGAGLFEAGAATIRAARAMRVLGEAVRSAGGRLVIGRARPGRTSGGRLDGLRILGEGDAPDDLSADAYVFACGPWLPELFPDLLGDLISVPRRDVYFFGPPSGDDRFSWPNLPNFSEGNASVYGYPDLDGRGVKVAPYGGVDPFDPDTDERIATAHWLKRAREWLSMRLPDLEDQPVVHSRVCQLENTPDAHFIIDRHPEMENAWIVGGGTGHAFKHGPRLGDYIAGRVQGEAGDPELEDVFSLNRAGRR